MSQFLPKPKSLLLTVEHGGNDVPPEYAGLFAAQGELLETHRGWDPGTLDLGRRLEEGLAVPLVAGTVTRLLVELNRSYGSEGLYSSITNGLSTAEKARIARLYYHPHRERVREEVGRLLRERGAPVLHVGLHSFTPVLDGQVREVEVGVLFDPDRGPEARLGEHWREVLEGLLPDERIRVNSPYTGISDGLPRWLRSLWREDEVVSYELEVNQKFVGSDDWNRVCGAIEESLRALLR